MHLSHEKTKHNHSAWNIGFITVQEGEEIRARLPPVAHGSDLCELRNEAFLQDTLLLFVRILL